MEFEKAKSEVVDLLKEFTLKLLEALGHPEAMVTDESYVSDMLSVFDEDGADNELETARRALGIPIKREDSIKDIVKYMANCAEEPGYSFMEHSCKCGYYSSDADWEEDCPDCETYDINNTCFVPEKYYDD